MGEAQLGLIVIGQVVYFAGWADALDLMYVRRGALPAAWRAVVNIMRASIRDRRGKHAALAAIDRPLPSLTEWQERAQQEWALACRLEQDIADLERKVAQSCRWLIRPEGQPMVTDPEKRRA
jgi:hypothetical protein